MGCLQTQRSVYTITRPLFWDLGLNKLDLLLSGMAKCIPLQDFKFDSKINAIEIAFHTIFVGGDGIAQLLCPPCLAKGFPVA